MGTKTYLSIFLLLFYWSKNYAQNTITLYPFNTEFATGYVGDDGKNYSGLMEDISSSTSHGGNANSGFVTFDLTKIPEGSQIVSAELIIFPVGSYTLIGSSGFAHATLLPVSPMHGAKTTKKEIKAGEVYAENLDWSATIIAPISSPINLAGVAGLNKRIGSSITFGIDPPKSTPNMRGVAGYNSTSSTAQRPQLNITYNSGAKTKPSADYSVSTRDTFILSEINFFDNSGGFPNSWTWDFGDGTSSTERNPKHMYSDTGLYTVKLSCKNAQGADSIIRSNFIKINEAPGDPLAEFRVDFRNVNANDDITFWDKSLGVVSTWKWYFGDGDSSEESNPIHAYIEDGKYSVTLIIQGPFGGDTVVKTDYINVGGDIQIPQANFSFESLDSLTLKFRDKSKNFPESWSWDFGDGEISTEPDPIHEYKELGNYKVCMIAENFAGSDTVCKNISVKPLGIKERNYVKNGIPLFPNPTTGLVYIRNVFNYVDEISIRNSLGAVMQVKSSFGNSEMLVDLQGFPSGLYHLLIKANGKVYTEKIIKM